MCSCFVMERRISFYGSSFVRQEMGYFLNTVEAAYYDHFGTRAF